MFLDNIIEFLRRINKNRNNLHVLILFFFSILMNSLNNLNKSNF